MSRGISQRLPSFRRAVIVACVAVLSTFGQTDVRAATFTWNTTTGLWSDGTSWLGGTAPANDTTTDTAAFSASNGNQTVQFGAGRSIAGITVSNTGSTLFSSDSSTARLLTLGASGFTIDAGAGVVTLGTSSAPVNLAVTTSSLTNNSSNPFTIAGSISRAAGDTSARTLTFAGSGNTTVSGGLVNGGASSNLAVTKSGAGAVTLVGSGVTYTGPTAVTSGTMIFRDTTAGVVAGTTGFTSRTTVSPGATIVSQRTVAGAANRAAILGSDNGGSSAWVSGTGVLNVDNAANTAGTADGGWTIFLGSNALTMSGTVNINSGVLSRDGPGTNVFNTTATFNVASGAVFGAGRGGNSSIGALNGGGDVGVLYNLSTSTLVVGNGGGSGTFSGGIRGNGTGGDFTLNTGILGLTKTGTGTQVLSGSNSYSGGTTIDAGTLQIGDGGTTGSIAASSSITGSAGATLAFNRSDSYGGNFTNSIGGGINLAVLGTGTLTLPNANTFTGSTRVTAGRLVVSNALALQSSTLDTADAGTVSFGQNSTVGGLTGSRNLDLGGFTLSVGNNNASTTYSGTLANGALTKIGSGTLSLTAANSYTGTTSVNAGTLQIGSGGTTGSLSSSSFTGSAGATLAFNRSDNFADAFSNIGGGIGLTKLGAGAVTLVGSGVTYTGPTAVTSGTMIFRDTTAGVVAGTTGFTSRTTVSPGATIVSQRTVAGAANRAAILGSDNGGSSAWVSGTGVLNVDNAANTAGTADGGWTVFLGSNALTMSGTVNINSGVLSRDGPGTNVFNTTATFNVASGAVFGAGRGGNSSIGALNGGGDVGVLYNLSTSTLVVGNGGGSGTFSGGIRGNGTGGDFTLNTGILGLTKTGTGTQVLSGSNSYSGATTISAGRLEIASAGRINGSSGVTINGSTAELKYNSATSLTAPLTFTQGTLSGTGTIGTAVNVGSGAIHSPGNSPGTQAVASETWAPGGKYVWELNALTGTAGTNWDLIAVSGTLGLSSLSSSSKFLIDLVTLTPGNTAGSLGTPYAPGPTYVFPIVSYSGLTVPGSYSTAAGSDLTSLFQISLASWQGTQPNASDISVWVNATGNGLDLVIVPEPGSLAIAAAGIGLALASRQLRRRG